MCHDTLEDTRTSVFELTDAFGLEIAGVVLEVTYDRTLDRAARKRLQVEHAATLSQRAKLVKLADKICKLREVSQSPPLE